jgi:hypothetical protein
MARRANLPQDALSLGDDISVDGRIQMNQTLSNAACGLAAVALKAWAAVTHTCRTMLAEETKPYHVDR